MASSGSGNKEGLMAFWADIDADYVLRYQQWHNCEHVPERVSIPGFLEGRRYRAINNDPHFLMYYPTKSTSVLASDAYHARLNAPTPWTREALGHFRKPVRGIYTELMTAGERGKFTAPYIISIRFDLREGGEAEYAERWIPAATKAIDGVERVRFYKADSAIGNMATAEKKTHGGGPGKQVYLVFIETSSPPEKLGNDPIGKVDQASGVSSKRENEEKGIYWLEVAHRAE